MSFKSLRIDEAAMLLRLEVEAILREVKVHSPVLDQLDRASQSAVCNAAEARGQLTAPKQAYFYSVCRGSSDEVRSCLQVLVQNGSITWKRAFRPIGLTYAIGKMITALLKTLTTLKG